MRSLDAGYAPSLPYRSTHTRDKSTNRAFTALPETMISPTEIGSLNRLGPELPGLTYKIPSRSCIIGLCE